jgi:pilus assembly protein CpaE
MQPLTAGLVVSQTALAEEVRSVLRHLPARVVFEHDTGAWKEVVESATGLRPDVILLDITQLGRPLDEAIRSLRFGRGDPMVVALHTTATPETILAAMRAGASEYLCPPFEAGLRGALERRAAELEGRRHDLRVPGKILGFTSAKGGCGATTIACHMAAEMGRAVAPQNQHVLLADLDLESGLVGFLMKASSPYTMLDAVQNLHRLDRSYWKALVAGGWPGLDVILSPAAPLSEPVNGDKFRQVLVFTRSQYDWILADLGRNLGLLAQGVLAEIDELYLIATMEVPTLHRTKQVVQWVLNTGYDKERLRLLLNRTPQPGVEVTPEEIEKILGLPVHGMLPNDYLALDESYCEGKLLPPVSNLNRQIIRMAAKLAGIPEQKNRRRFMLFG